MGEQVTAQEGLDVAACLTMCCHGSPARREHEVQRSRRWVQQAHRRIGQTTWPAETASQQEVDRAHDIAGHRLGSLVDAPRCVLRYGIGHCAPLLYTKSLCVLSLMTWRESRSPS